MAIKGFLFANKRRKRWFIFSFLVALIIFSTYFLEQWGSQPSNVVVNLPTPHNNSLITGYQSLLTPYFKTKIPTGFRIQRPTNDASLPRYYVIATSSSNDILISFVSEDLSTYGLNGIPDYYMRETNSASYQIVHNSLLPMDSKTFETTAGNNGYTLFTTHNNRYVAITVSDGIPLDLFDILIYITNNWTWL